MSYMYIHLLCSLINGLDSTSYVLSCLKLSLNEHKQRLALALVIISPKPQIWFNSSIHKLLIQHIYTTSESMVSPAQLQCLKTSLIPQKFQTVTWLSDLVTMSYTCITYMYMYEIINILSESPSCLSICLKIHFQV